MDLWDHFEKCDDDLHEKKAKCRHCDKIYCYSSTVGNLKTHLERHNISVHRRALARQSRSSSIIKHNRRVMWKNFTKINDDEKIAACNICDKQLSYKSTTGNLKMHLKQVHTELHGKLFYTGSECNEERSGEGSEEDQSSEDESKEDVEDVSGYFERETGGRARCAVCRTTAPYRAAAMRRHLRDHHPKLLPGEQEANQDDDNNLFTEVIYLEDNPQKSEEKRSKRLRKRSEYNERLSWRHSSPAREGNVTPRTKKRRPSTPEPRNNPEHEEIESFGAYITCLLKSLPKDVCSAVQRDIITLVVNAKLTKPEIVETPVILKSQSISEQKNYIVIENQKNDQESNAEVAKVAFNVEIGEVPKDNQINSIITLNNCNSDSVLNK